MVKFKQIIIEFFKGIAVGVVFAIPGFSAGTMAIMLGIYDKLINEISNVSKHPLKAIKALLGIGIGLIIGILSGIIGIVALLNSFPIPTVLFLIGMIIGSLPQIFMRARKETKKISSIDVIVFSLCLLILIALPFIPGVSEATKDITLATYFIVVIMGIISAGALIIPGISGSLILMALGYYLFVMTNISDFFSNFIHQNYQLFWKNFYVVLSFGIGVLIGLVLFSKLMSFLLKKYERTVCYGMIGFLLASPFAILYALYSDGDYREIALDTSPIQWIVGSFLLIGGVVLALYLNKLEQHKEVKEISDESK